MGPAELLRIWAYRSSGSQHAMTIPRPTPAPSPQPDPGPEPGPQPGPIPGPGPEPDSPPSPSAGSRLGPEFSIVVEPAVAPG
jgi:hypothetical protein